MEKWRQNITKMFRQYETEETNWTLLLELCNMYKTKEITADRERLTQFLLLLLISFFAHILIGCLVLLFWNWKAFISKTKLFPKFSTRFSTFGQRSATILELENKFQQNNTFKIFETIKASILGVPRLGSVVLLF